MSDLILYDEFMDEQLKAMGIQGHVDPNTDLFLVQDNEPARKLLTARKVRPKKYTRTERECSEG